MEGGHEQETACSLLVCNICLVGPTDPVLTSCGHLFCWPCVYRWLRERAKPCPVCKRMLKANVDISPVYGGGAVEVGSGAGAAVDGIAPRPNPAKSVADVERQLAAVRVLQLTSMFTSQQRLDQHRISSQQLQLRELRRERKLVENNARELRLRIDALTEELRASQESRMCQCNNSTLR